MPEQDDLGTVVLRLSTGYEVEIDLSKPRTAVWRRHLALAVLGERVFAEDKEAKDRLPGGLPFDAIPEEIMFLLATMPDGLKDILLYQIFYEDILKLAPRLDRKLGKRS